MNVNWPLPFEDEAFDVNAWKREKLIESLHPYHGEAPKTAPNPSTASRAFSGPMECKHLLPPSQCAWCLNTKELVFEEPWEKKDYVTTTADMEPQGLDASAEIEAGEVHPREIYGVQTALRIKHALGKSTI